MIADILAATLKAGKVVSPTSICVILVTRNLTLRGPNSTLRYVAARDLLHQRRGGRQAGRARVRRHERRSRYVTSVLPSLTSPDPHRYASVADLYFLTLLSSHPLADCIGLAVWMGAEVAKCNAAPTLGKPRSA